MARSPGNPDIPTRNGVAASCVALPPLKAAPWNTVLEFLVHRMPKVGRDAWAHRLAAGLVLGEDGHDLRPDAPYRGGLRLYYYRDVPDEAPIPFEETVLYQDAHLVVADKPHFLPVMPAGRFVQQTLLVRLQQRLGLPLLAPLHRIDRETTGLVLFAVNPDERGRYHALFGQHTLRKTYEAIAPWREDLQLPLTRRSRIEEHGQDFFRMCEAPDHLGAVSNSETRIALIERRGPWARYRLEPITGKRHQLRVHMGALGLPIVGDQLYPRALHGPDDAEDFSNPLQLLAKSLAFTDPITGEARSFESARDLNWPATYPIAVL
jgi:tRNA pseudouridine32 synthase / 23S rRNA pseudouridine746 synthase